MFLSSRLLRFLSALFIAIACSPASAQTFFGSGATTNSASNTPNVAFGYHALFSNTTGIDNTAMGIFALQANTTGNYNTAFGFYALLSNTTASLETALGDGALFSNTTGEGNTALGVNALHNNTTGVYNSAVGVGSLGMNTTGSYNTAIGDDVLIYNTTGSYNFASGSGSLFSNTTGSYNIGNGYGALWANTTGRGNTANGYRVEYKNTTGVFNVAAGYQALYYNTSGSYNIAQGYDSLYEVNRGSYNIGVGYEAGYNIVGGSNNIAIGNPGAATDSGVIRIGTAGTHTATLIAGVTGTTIGSGVAVYIDPNGKLGTLTSSRRFKRDIKPIGSLSDKLLQLRPVSFRYKQADSAGAHPLQYGLIAEEVAKVFPELVQCDKQGKPFTVYYHLLTPLLLNELQKERSSRKAEAIAQNAKIATLTANYSAKIEALQAELASMKRAQTEQAKLLNQLAIYIQSQKAKIPSQKADLVQK